VLRKFISIKNVGRFEKCNATGHVELKAYNLIFAENGRGKTTLCAILRSLQSGDPTHVIGRTTLGSTDPPEINILTNGGIATFRLGAWTAPIPEIAIFDSTFVSENVHSGEVVSIDHRRSLYTVIVGKHGVDLAQKIDGLDGKSRAKAAEISEKTSAVQAFAPRGMTVEVFIALQEDPAIADQTLDILFLLATASSPDSEMGSRNCKGRQDIFPTNSNALLSIMSGNAQPSDTLKC
jgi:wobble nucleotide-excising tRNase